MVLFYSRIANNTSHYPYSSPFLVTFIRHPYAVIVPVPRIVVVRVIVAVITVVVMVVMMVPLQRRVMHAGIVRVARVLAEQK